MKRVLTFILLFVSAQFLSAETVYRTVDERGHAVFSDRPSSSAEKVDIGEPQIIRGSRLSPSAAEESEKLSQEKKSPGEKYTLIAINNPAHDAAIRSNAGELSVSVRVEPALKLGDKISIFMDGRVIASGTGTKYTVSEIDRGTHTLRAQIINAAGRVTISSSPVRFHMLRFHIVKPAGNQKN